MKNITLDRIKELAQINEPQCISIFIPTYRAGMEVNSMIDQKHLKNQVKKIRKELESQKLKERDIGELLQPLNELVENSGFWKLQSDGLVIFRNRLFFEYYTLPVLFEPFVNIADHFYTMPLIPYINDGVKFYLLAISLHGVKFFEGYPHQITEVEVKDLLPQRLEEVVGFDFEEKHLQYRSGNDDRGRATYHGHGSTSQEEAKMEILKYFRAINTGVMELLRDKNYPLILAAVDYLVPIYREANDYKHLYRDFITGNPQHEDPVLLHEKARELLRDYYDSDRKEKIISFEQALSLQKASYKEEEIVPAAISGRIDTLFVKKGETLWGIYDQESGRIMKRDREAAQNSCLLNMAAMHTIFNSGRVFLLESDDMPEPASRLNAILRY
jgi:hypothetical protein